MDKKKIDRINELAKKARSSDGLTPEEMTERAPFHNGKHFASPTPSTDFAQEIYCHLFPLVIGCETYSVKRFRSSTSLSLSLPPVVEISFVTDISP